ncbi:MAG: acyl-CoA dehydrogenase family protein [Candidatus Bathyarchaeia archaeon]
MDYALTEEEKLFKNTVHEFCEKYIAPTWIEVDEKKTIPLELIKKMAENGFYGIPLSPDYGGLGGTITMATIATEEVAHADPAVPIAVYTLLQNGWPYILQRYGSEDAKKEILPRVTKGDAFFGIASTEPQGGSDVANIRTKATKKGDSWVVNGEKVHVSGITEIQRLETGGWYLISRTGTVEEKHRGLSALAFLARKNGKTVQGFEPTLFDEIGRFGLSTGGFKLTNVEIEDKYRIGEPGKGFYSIVEGFNVARILVAAACLGAATWAAEQAIQWLRDRKLYGRSLASLQGVSFPFADMYTELEMIRQLIYKAAWLADQIYVHGNPNFSPRDLNIPVAMAKLKAPELAVKIFEETMKWYGAYGYTKECALHRGFLGTISYVIGAEGAQNVMRHIIARDTLGAEHIK